VVVAGNHDWCFVREPDAARALLGDATYLEDGEATIDGVRFYGSPWQPAYDDWAFNLPRDSPELAEKWRRIPRSVDVLVTHGPPEGIGDRGPVPGRLGCAALRQELARVRPKLHLFGHIHTDGGLRTSDSVTVVNCTAWECERAPTVVDLVDGRVVPVRIPPARGR